MPRFTTLLRFLFLPAIVSPGLISAPVSTPPAETPVIRETRLRAELAALAEDDFTSAAESTRFELARLLVFKTEHDFSTAVALLEPLLARATATSTPDPDTIEHLQHTLGMAYAYTSREAEARALLDASCASAAFRLGPEHTETLTYRGNRATFLARIGETASAEAELRTIASIYHRRDPDSDDALHTRTQWMISLGRLGRWGEAETEIRDIINRRTRLLGPDHPDLSHQLNLLCWVLYSTNRAIEAIPLLEQLVAIRTRELGPHSSRTLTVRYNLATVYARAGRYADAESILRTDLAALQTRPAESHREAADYLFKLGELALYQNDPATAVAKLTRAQSLYLQPQNQSWRDREQRGLEKTRLLLARALFAHGDIEAARHTARDWLSQLEAQFNLHLAYTSEADRLAFLSQENPFDLPGTLGDPDLLARGSLRLKGLVLDSLLEDQRLARNADDPTTRKILRAYQATLAASVSSTNDYTVLPVEGSPLEQLERELARRAVPLGIQRAALAAHPADLLASLSADAAFIDYLRYRHDVGQLVQEERYLALIGLPSGWKVVPLGSASAIDDAINRYHILVQRGGPIAWAQAVRRLTLDPVRAVLSEETKRLFVSPDGLLQNVAFASLPEDDVTRIAADRHVFVNITSGRDLLPRAHAPAKGEPLVLAAPLWSGELAALPPLPESIAEGEAITARFPSATLLTGASANAAALRQHPSPQVLHIATHTVSDPSPDLPLATRLRRTGLALAGEPGLLDTLQIAALDLRGTALVFLSGCKTGGGAIAHGEGVLGLQRGFARTGARALVLTLWPVADQDSRDFTAAFYTAYFATSDPVTALQEARENLRAKLSAQGLSSAELLRRTGAHIISVRH